VLLSQDRPSVETILRQRDGAWSFQNHNGLAAVATFRSLGIEIPLTEIYAGIEFPASDVPDAGGGAQAVGDAGD
jgi:hypothetical protein